MGYVLLIKCRDEVMISVYQICVNYVICSGVQNFAVQETPGIFLDIRQAVSGAAVSTEMCGYCVYSSVLTK